MPSEDPLFTLHPRLEADSFWIADLPLCQLRLVNDARFIWGLLVPRRAHISEITQMSEVDYTQLMTETRDIGAALLQAFAGDKLNIGALGNMVPQLHMHVIIRRKDDAAWPGAVWGSDNALAYDAEDLRETVQKIQALL